MCRLSPIRETPKDDNNSIAGNCGTTSGNVKHSPGPHLRRAGYRYYHSATQSIQEPEWEFEPLFRHGIEALIRTALADRAVEGQLHASERDAREIGHRTLPGREVRFHESRQSVVPAGAGQDLHELYGGVEVRGKSLGAGIDV